VGVDEFYTDLLERALREELRIVNKYIPYRRENLCKLLEMRTPYYVSRDGTISLLDRKELLLLKELLGEEACKLLVPIIIEYKPSLGEATYIVRDEVAAKAIARLLGIRNFKKSLTLYRANLYEVRAKLRTATLIVFMPE